MTFMAKMAMPDLQLDPYISIFVILKTNYFELWFLYKSDLQISTTEKHYQNQIFLNDFHMTGERFQGYLNESSIALHGGSLEITLQPL